MKYIVSFLFFISFLSAQPLTLQHIRILQDKRVVQSMELNSFLNSSSSKLRREALLAAANIQDTTAIDVVEKLLNDEDSSVRSMAAFALGLLGRPQSIEPLFARLWKEKDEKTVREILNAIGRCGSSGSLAMLIDNLRKISPKFKPYIAEAFARFSIRRVRDMNTYPVLVSMLKDKSCAEEAMYALMRINDSSVANIYSDEILPYLKHKSPHVRMWSATILGNSTDGKIKQQLVGVAKNDVDWRVRVNALRALRNSPLKSIENTIKLLAEYKNEHVSLTALSTLEGLLSDNEIRSQQSFFKNIVTNSKRYTSRQRGEAALILGRRMKDSAVKFLEAQLNDDMALRPYIIKALGETKSLQAFETVSSDIRHSAPLVRIVAIEASQKIAGIASESFQRQFLTEATVAFNQKDAGISLTAAAAFEDTLFSKSLRKEFLQYLVDAYQAMDNPNDLEPMVELQNVFAELADSASLKAVEKGLLEEDAVIREAAGRAYKAITGKASLTKNITSEYKPFYRPEDLELVQKCTGAEITTNKGKIKITFAKEAAPFTVLNFILLAKKKFYDGLTFHRVVSNFVIQGGDPLGNGSGGPGYSIRTEVHPDAHYTTGAVGMASAGKDTEGSQFFITHSPAPHLDGRYTIFAYTKEMNVVDKIMVGDKIEKVVVF